MHSLLNHCQYFHQICVYIWVAGQVSYKKQDICQKRWFPKICLRTFLILIWSDINVVFSTYFIFCSIFHQIRLHQSNQAHSTTCITLNISKYQDPYFIPCCNLQSMNMYVQSFFWFIFTDVRWKVIMNRNFKLWPIISSISRKRTKTEKDTTYKRFCNKLQWVHSKSKDCKPKN